MTNQHLPEVSPTEGFSVARQAMKDAIAFYLPIGGPALARQHVESLANSMNFYSDITEAYCEAMNEISQIEKAEQQQQQQELILKLMGAVNPRKKDTAAREPHSDSQVGEKISSCNSELPAKLCTDKAMLMWQRLQQEGLIDKHYQPVKLSRTELAILAFDISEFLGLSEKWKIFERLWGKKNLRTDYNKALFQQKSIDFRERLKLILKPT